MQETRTLKKQFGDLAAEAFGKASIHRGIPFIQFSDSENNLMAEHCRFTLIGKFSQGSPPFKVLQTKLSAFGFKGAVFVGFINFKHVMIKLTNEEDRLWTRQFVHIDGYPMRIFKWTPEFDPKAESSLMPIWVSFPELPLHLFDKRALFSIAALLGKPLRIDEPTADRTRPSVARVCIEIDLLQPLHDVVCIGLGDHVVEQHGVADR